MKKKLSLLLAAVLAMGSLAACGGNATSSSVPATADSPESEPASTAASQSEAAPSGDGVKLTFMTNIVGTQAEELEAVLKEYTDETGVDVEFSAPGGSYEELMKTKMSANELPDLFTTHGWSVMRYSEYLEPLTGQPFVTNISEQIKPIITNADGDTLVLPVDMDIAGMVYNADVLEAAGVNVDDIKTWSDFSEACAAIRANGVDPIHMGGKDDWTIGQYGDWVAPSYFITNESDNQREALKSGTFDTATWEKVAGMMDEWVKAGYFNADALTADYNSDMAAMAEGNTAFCFYGNAFIVDARTINPDANLGMMPIPSASEDDEPSLIAGERLAVGVWKDSTQKEAALELLNWLAQPETVARLATAGGNPAGLTNATSDIGDIQTYVDKYANIRTFPYFDREYLPSGMWDVMCATGADILEQKSDAVVNAAKVMEQNFNDKF